MTVNSDQQDFCPAKLLYQFYHVYWSALNVYKSSSSSNKQLVSHLSFSLIFDLLTSITIDELSLVIDHNMIYPFQYNFNKYIFWTWTLSIPHYLQISSLNPYWDWEYLMLPRFQIPSLIWCPLVTTAGYIISRKAFLK